MDLHGHTREWVDVHSGLGPRPRPVPGILDACAYPRVVRRPRWSCDNTPTVGPRRPVPLRQWKVGPVTHSPTTRLSVGVVLVGSRADGRAG